VEPLCFAEEIARKLHDAIIDASPPEFLVNRFLHVNLINPAILSRGALKMKLSAVYLALLLLFPSIQKHKQACFV
jgi:hypothetical protein